MVVVNRLLSHRSPQLGSNALTSVPAELGQLSSLNELYVRRRADCLAELTHRTGRQQPPRVAAARVGSFAGDDHDYRELLPFLSPPTDNSLASQLYSNPLPIDVGLPLGFTNARSTLPELFAATTSLLMIREPATGALIGLADLDLPALLSVDILDALFPNSIPMHKKWDLVVAVKHWRQRRGIER